MVMKVVGVGVGGVMKCMFAKCMDVGRDTGMERYEEKTII